MWSIIVTLILDILVQGLIQRFWKGVALYVGHHGWSTKKSLGFRWSKKAKITLETKSLAKYFYQHFQIFSIFICNESLPMKYYQFFKTCQRFGKEIEKTLIQQSMRKEKLREVGRFIKSFNMIINHFLVSQAHLISGWRKKYQKEK